MRLCEGNQVFRQTVLEGLQLINLGGLIPIPIANRDTELAVISVRYRDTPVSKGFIKYR